MKDLKYISSAGLRLILIMKKGVKNNIVAVKNVNEDVAEILKTTGFYDVVEFI